MKYCKFYIILITFVLMLQTSLLGQSLQNRIGFGFGFGMQQLSGDAPKAEPAIGGNGSVIYRLGERVNLNFVAGYNLLRYKLTPSGKSFTTNMIYGDLFLDLELLRLKSFRPFISWGLGGFNFEAKAGKRYNDGEFLLGGGFRFYISPNIAFLLSATGKYTTGDDLDNIHKGGKDLYFSARAGLTFFKSKKKNFITKNPPFEPLPVEQAPSGELTNPASPELIKKNQQDEIEIQQLKAKINDLMKDLENKNTEITALQQALDNRTAELKELEKNQKARPTSHVQNIASASDFKAQYQNGLNQFENRRYQNALQIFQGLLLQNPNHPLASNCQYWIGESYYALGEYDQALQAFEKVFSYSQSFKKDDALLMSGLVYLKLGDVGKARETFTRLTTEYPESEYFAKAQRYLDRIKE